MNRIEREQGQEFWIDIEARMDLSSAGRSDLLGQTLNYDSLIKDLTRVVSAERFTLIEALAERLSEVVLEREGVRSVIVRVAKPNPPIDAKLDMVQVEILRPK